MKVDIKLILNHLSDKEMSMKTADPTYLLAARNIVTSCFSV